MQFIASGVSAAPGVQWRWGPGEVPAHRVGILPGFHQVLFEQRADQPGQAEVFLGSQPARASRGSIIQSDGNVLHDPNNNTGPVSFSGQRWE